MVDHQLTLSPWKRYWEESGRLEQHRRLLLDTTDAGTAIIDHKELIVAHIPLHELQQRRFELPGRSVSFGVLISSASPNEGDKVATPTTSTLELLAKSLLVCSTPWRGQLWVISHDADDDWKQFRQEHSIVAKPLIPLPRLWSPDALVAQKLAPLLKQLKDKKSTLSIWDLGAGFGRDVCYLAETLQQTESNRVLQITAVDQRYREPDSNETTAFWQRRGVSFCRCLCLDLQQDVDAVLAQLANVDCVYAVRYWNVKLFTALAERGTVPVVAVSQFGKPIVGAPWEFTSPKVGERSNL